MTKRATYTKEFKIEAIRLLESGDKPAAEVAANSASVATCSTSGKSSCVPEAI